MDLVGAEQDLSIYGCVGTNRMTLAEVVGSNLTQSIIINLVNYGIVLNSLLSIRPTKSSIINIYTLQNYE